MPADSFECPLTLAACGGHVELAMLLLERGANIEEVNDEGYTPLMEASREGHEEMVALLLSQVNNTVNCILYQMKSCLGFRITVSLQSRFTIDAFVSRELTSTLRLRRPRRRP